MILKAFAFLDLKTGSYSLPFFHRHMGEAIRTAMDLGSDKNTQIGRYPGDFELVELGSFCQATGQFSASTPHPLGVVVTYLAPGTSD